MIVFPRCMLAAMFVVLTAHGQDQPAPEGQGAQKPAPEGRDTQGGTQGLPGLDDLLGLPGEHGSDTAAEEAARRELEDKLTDRQMADQFKEAVRLMGQTADRLQAARDTGLATQRMQEDVLRKLDALIESAKRRQAESSESDASRGQREQGPSQPNQGRSEQNRAGQGENRGQVDPPARREGPINPPVDSAGAAWGSLPARVREALTQGQSDAYSSLYRALTEAYYRRLAEEANK